MFATNKRKAAYGGLITNSGPGCSSSDKVLLMRKRPLGTAFWILTGIAALVAMVVLSALWHGPLR